MKKINLIKVLLPLIIIIGSMYALRNGVVVRKMPDLGNEPISIILFYIISLFTFGAKDFGDPIAGPIMLQFIFYSFYFIAPLITLVAMADFMSLIRPAFVKWIMKNKDYYVIIGYGKMGKAAMEAINLKKGKKTFVLIIDKNIDESDKGFSILFEHTIYFRNEVENIEKWDNFISKKIAGVFIVTDDELLNLKIYDSIKKHIGDETIVYNRIKSMEISLKWDNSSTKQKLNWINNYIASTDLLFQPNEELNKLNKNNIIYQHFNTQKRTFDPWLEKKFDVVLFFGFGTFSQYIFKAINKINSFNKNIDIYIIDPNGRKNWNEISVEIPSENKYNVQFIENDFTTIIEKLSMEFNKNKNCNFLGVYGTNFDFENLQSASFINRTYKANKNVHNIVRTQYHNLLPNEMLNDFFYTNEYILIPTFSWSQLDIELLLTE